MTDERLEQILKQSFDTEINDSEIQIHRKVSFIKINMKKIIACGLVACAVLSFVVTSIHFRTNNKNGADNVASHNLFAITAYAAELPKGIKSGDVMSLSESTTSHGNTSYLEQRFSICGDNIKRIKITTDKCNIYTTIPVFSGEPDFENARKAGFGDADEYYAIYVGEPEEGGYIDHYEHSHIVGQSYECDYNESMMFGMSVPEELWSTNDDIKQSYYEDVDQVDGATITIAVTYEDGSVEEHHYLLNTGKIFLPTRDGYYDWNNLTRFLTTEEENAGEALYSYGYLMTRLD